MKKHPIITSLAISSSLFLTACGGGGGSSSKDAQANPPSSSTPEVFNGSFIDSPVENLAFSTSSNRSGKTGPDGGFEFEKNDSVVFSLGSVEFEPVVAKSGITPLELFNTGDIDDSRVVNFSRLIQSLDDDNDISERITIGDNIASVVDTSGLTLTDFELDPIDFESNERVKKLLTDSGKTSLIPIEPSKIHLQQTLRDSEVIDRDNDGEPNKTDIDDDNDGIQDVHDIQPYNGLISGDFDGDGIDNIEDSDDDNDGTEDTSDAFPFDPSETKDFDQDNIGDNADPDDDNDGVADDIDEFPFDPEKSGDTDKDGIDNLFDEDDDGDNIADIDDAFPLDPSEQYDFDGDGIGDNADIDDDNDNIPDSEDRLNVTGQKSSYIREEKISLKAKGFDHNFEVAKSEDGWHIQFYTYDVDQPGSYLTEYTNGGSYNATFDEFSKLWSIEYWAPSKPGNYRTEITLYCSFSPSTCDTEAPDHMVTQEIFFSSICAEDPCTYEPLAPRGNYVTQTANSTVSPAFVTRANGELFAVYSDHHANTTNTTKSIDGGVTWEDIGTLPARVYGQPDILETPGGQLIFTALCSGGGGICLYSSFNGIEWTQRDVSSSVNYSRCSSDLCTEEISVESIIQRPDNSFVISYAHRFEEDSAIDYDVFVTSSQDLENWTDPIKVSTPTDWSYNSDLLQTTDGTTYLSYYTSGAESAVIAKSIDLINWENIYELGSYRYASNPRLVEISEKPALFYVDNFNLYYSYLQQSGSFSDPKMLLDQIPFGPDVKTLGEGKLGIIYEADLNNQRDIFFEILEGVTVDN